MSEATAKATGEAGAAPAPAAASGPLVSVVLAITDNEAHPRKVIDGFGAALAQGGYRSEFVVVIDGPIHRFDDELAELATRWTVHIVSLEGGGLGESIALSAGVGRAQGELVVNAPPYLQIEPDDVVDVVKALEAGADCVATWRDRRVDPWLNQLQSRLFNRMLRLIMNAPFHDLNSGTRGFRRQVLEEVAVYGELYRFLPVLALRQGFRVVEVRVRHKEEKGRAGFYGVGVYLRRLLDILAITFLTRFTQRPLRFFGYVGFAAALVGVLLAVWPLWDKLANDNSLADRPLFVLGAILAAFGVQLIGFGLIGEIIIFTQAPNLRDYKVEEEVAADGTAAVRGAELDESAAEDPPAVAVADGVSATAKQDELPVRVRELLPGEDARWDAYVSRHAQGTFFHRTGWSRTVGEIFRHEPHHLVVEQGRRWLGVLPLFLTKSPFLGRNLVSVPYSVYGGVLASDERAHELLLARAGELGEELSVGFVELRHLELRPGDRPRSDLYVTFRCELPDDPAEVMKRIPKKRRAEVRAAREPQADGTAKRRRSFGIQVRDDGSIDELFRLFAYNKRRLGSPSLPKRWFQALRDEFGKAAVIHRAIEPSGRTIAAVMSFTFKDTVYAYYSGSLGDVNHTGVNNYIYCAIMEWAVENGYRRFDFGRSRVGSGPAKFKINMGFQPEPLHYEYLLVGPGSKLPEFHPSNPKLALPRRIWSKMPMTLCNSLGARLSRYLP
ncbi:MAG TPA: FemAB family PEP-CTERM system-associated protein [bacterium]|nr:FemAB family PEP-CTERM system-associated protein [bacterium]